MTVEYSQLNSIVLAQPPHHGRPRLNVVVVEAEGYPKATKAKRKTGKDVNGITTWAPVGIWRGLDPRLIKGYNEKYNGANLRKIRAVKGVGRPCLVP